jgi:hypothetical protein
MGLAEELPVYKKSYDLLLQLFELTRHFKREYKYTIGNTLKNEVLDLITLIFRANSRTDKEAILQTAREHIEVIRLYIRAFYQGFVFGLIYSGRQYNRVIMLSKVGHTQIKFRVIFTLC